MRFADTVADEINSMFITDQCLGAYRRRFSQTYRLDFPHFGAAIMMLSTKQTKKPKELC
jgi:hypothetical protein